MAQLIEAAFLSEFDIDKGSTLRWAVPAPIRGYPASFLAEHQLPEGAHNREYEFTVFQLYPDTAADGSIFSEAFTASSLTKSGDDAAVVPKAGADKLCLRCISVARTRIASDKKRGAELKSFAVASRHHFIDQLRPLLVACLDVLFADPSKECLQRLMHEINRIPVSSMPVYSMLERQMLRASIPMQGKSLTNVHVPTPAELTLHKGDASESLDSLLNWEYRGELRLAKDAAAAEVHLKVPLYNEPSVYHTASLSMLFKRFGAGIMAIYNAVLLQKRIIFLAHKDVPAGEVCNMALACAHLVSPPIVTFQHRLFPYATLHDLNFLQVPGFIAGVTNPLFESKRKWWDLLCYVGPEDVDGKPLGMPGGSNGSTAGAFTASTVSGSLAKVFAHAPQLPVAAAPETQEATVTATTPDEVEGTTKEGTKAEPGAKPDTPKMGAVSKLGKITGSGAAAQAVADAAARLSRVVVSYPSMFTDPDMPADITGAPAILNLPTVPTLYVPWKEFDQQLFVRARSGAKYGEQWLREAVQVHTAAILQLAALHQRMEETAVLAREPTESQFSAAQQQLLATNDARLKALRSSEVYTLFLQQRFEEEGKQAEKATAAGQAVPNFNKLKVLSGILRQPALLGGKPTTHSTLPVWNVVYPETSRGSLAASTKATLAALPMPPSEKARASDQLKSVIPGPVPVEAAASGPPSAPSGVLDVLDRLSLAAGDASLLVDETAPGKLDAGVVFTDLEQLLNSAQAQLFFAAHHPESAGGLNCLAWGALHTDPVVRSSAVTLLERFRSHPWLPVRIAANRINVFLSHSVSRHAGLSAAISAL